MVATNSCFLIRRLKKIRSNVWNVEHGGMKNIQIELI